jgi:pimeloyl-ACP methyl ester carboxylesterase
MTLTNREAREISRANASGLKPAVFVHGLWLLPSSWDKWRALFEEHGFTTLSPSWPGDPETVTEAREHPEVFAKKSLKTVTDHYAEVIDGLSYKPSIVGHSFGGVITEELAGMGLSNASVAIDPAPFRGVLPLPLSALKSATPVLANPANRGRAVELTFDQFTYGWANTLDEAEARELYETYHVPGSGLPLFQAAFSNLNPWTEDRVNTKNPDRGPLLLISGNQDNTVPWAIVNASFQRQERNPGVTEVVQIPDRGHSLTIDHGWREVADTALEFVVRHTASKAAAAA